MRYSAAAVRTTVLASTCFASLTTSSAAVFSNQMPGNVLCLASTPLAALTRPTHLASAEAQALLAGCLGDAGLDKGAQARP